MTTRTLLAASSLALTVAAGCGGGSPAAPTTTPAGVGATIAGTVNRAAEGPAGLTVTVVGTSLSAV